jgi:CheY-like chemotaxis protein
MVQGMAEQSGGRLVLMSQQGKGTTAELWLPAADALSIAANAAPSEMAPSQDHPNGQPLDVLLVDDDSLVLMNTAAMLEDLGHRVVTAASGSAALTALTERSFDLLLTDHAMPHMTGAQLVGEVAALYPAMPVIIATGFAELPDGVSDITRLRKPYFQQELADAVSKIRKGAQSACSEVLSCK